MAAWLETVRQKMQGVAQTFLQSRRRVLRIGLQTIAATAVVYVITATLAPQHLSWAVISALFTIGLSADATFHSAIGRSFGAILGAGLGLLVTGPFESPVIIALLIGTAAANMIAAVWP